MKTYTVVFAPQAEDDLVAILEYISGHGSPAGAARYTEAIVAYCETLSTFPHRGTQRSDIRPSLRIKNYRRRAVIAFEVNASPVSSPSWVCSMAGATSTAPQAATTSPTTDGADPGQRDPVMGWRQPVARARPLLTSRQVPIRNGPEAHLRHLDPPLRGPIRVGSGNVNAASDRGLTPSPLQGVGRKERRGERPDGGGRGSSQRPGLERVGLRVGADRLRLWQSGGSNHHVPRASDGAVRRREGEDRRHSSAQPAAARRFSPPPPDRRSGLPPDRWPRQPAHHPAQRPPARP